MNRIFVLLVMLVPFSANAQYITTFAGNGTPSYVGLGGPATAAGLSAPRGVAVDKSGNVYIACWGGSRVVKVNSSGIINTFAGITPFGYSGDGGPATAAQLYYPTTVAFDGAGNVYIADATNKRIRKVSPSGIITTFAGNGTAGHSGDGGAATAAQLSYPAGIAFDGSGNAYIADQYNHNVRKVSSSGIITTFAGNNTLGYSGDGGLATSAQLSNPVRVIVDAGGNVIIDDYGNSRIRKVDAAGMITLVAGNGSTVFGGDGGQATAAQLAGPVGISIDGLGNLYIADWGNNRIRKINTAGVISTIAGTGIAGYNGDCILATAAQLDGPIGVAIDEAGHIFISDYGDHRVRVFSPSCNLGLNDVSIEKDRIEIFPNPVVTEFSIVSLHIINQVTISNLLGQTIYHHEYSSEKVQVDIADLPSGIYFVRINGTDVRRFVKQ